MILLDDLLTFLFFIWTLKKTIAFDIIVPHIIPKTVFAHGMKTLVDVCVSFYVIEFDWISALRVSTTNCATAWSRLLRFEYVFKIYSWLYLRRDIVFFRRRFRLIIVLRLILDLSFRLLFFL